MAFEKSFNKEEVKKINDLLNNPTFPPLNTLSDDNLRESLAYATDLLAEHNIVVDVIHEVPDREIYRFITEELIHEEIQIIDVPGMVSHFTYEEFHPNDQEDLKRYTEEFIEMLMSKDFQFMEHVLFDKVIYQGEMIKEKLFVEKLSDHLSDIEHLKLKELNIQSVEIDDNKAVVQSQLTYDQKPKGSQSLEYTDHVKTEFIHKYGYWYIKSVKIPGLGI